jgi:hypothetical protein
MKKNIKNYIIAIAVLILLLVLISFVITFINKKDAVSDVQNQTSESSCEQFTTAADIFDNGTLADCGCLDDEIEKSQCELNIENRDLYNEALSTPDINLCEGISINNMKESCLKVVQSKIDYIESQGIDQSNEVIETIINGDEENL